MAPAPESESPPPGLTDLWDLHLVALSLLSVPALVLGRAPPWLSLGLGALMLPMVLTRATDRSQAGLRLRYLGANLILVAGLVGLSALLCALRRALG